MVLPNNAKKLYNADLIAHTNAILLVNKFKLGNFSIKVAALSAGRLSPQPHLCCSKIAGLRFGFD